MSSIGIAIDHHSSYAGRTAGTYQHIDGIGNLAQGELLSISGVERIAQFEILSYVDDRFNLTRESIVLCAGSDGHQQKCQYDVQFAFH